MPAEPLAATERATDRTSSACHARSVTAPHRRLFPGDEELDRWFTFA